MNWKIALGSLAAISLLAGPATALTLTNEDDEAYKVEIIQGQGDETREVYEIGGREALSDICEDGCTIKLSTGAESDFNGDEDVMIKDGEFVFKEDRS